MKIFSNPRAIIFKYIKYVFKCDCLGGYRERETPGSIPNPEAKPLIADNTAPVRCGNVGRCLVDHFLTILTFTNHTIKTHNTIIKKLTSNYK